MTRAEVIRVVVCAGGLGTRIAGRARYIPKEFYPADGRPGIVHLLEEISAVGPAEVVIVCHPYYDAFTTWARIALSLDGHDSYQRAARLPALESPAAGLTISFITQHGPYADITSVLNGASYLASHKDLHVAFADNLYRGPNPLLALQAAPLNCSAVLARAYQPELTASRGVIATRSQDGQLLMIDLTEKPSAARPAQRTIKLSLLDPVRNKKERATREAILPPALPPTVPARPSRDAEPWPDLRSPWNRPRTFSLRGTESTAYRETAPRCPPTANEVLFLHSKLASDLEPPYGIEP